MEILLSALLSAPMCPGGTTFGVGDEESEHLVDAVAPLGDVGMVDASLLVCVVSLPLSSLSSVISRPPRMVSLAVLVGVV